MVARIGRDPFENLLHRVPCHRELTVKPPHEPDMDDPALGVCFETIDDCGFPIRLRTFIRCRVATCGRWWVEDFWWCGRLPIVEHCHTRPVSRCDR